MMNGHRKSDRLVVPAKSSNNVGQPAAKGAEGRGLAKGNPPQQNMPLGLSAVPGMLSALARIRHAVSFKLSGVTTRGKSRMR